MRWFNFTIRRLMALVAALAVLFAVVSYLNQIGRMNRDASRRAQCVNNLKQIGLGIHEYLGEAGTFPTGSVANPDLRPDQRLGWNYLIAPNLEIRPRFQPGELTLAADDPSLAGYQTKPPYAALCPTLRSRPSAHYAGIAGLGLDSPSLPKGDPRAGVFGDDRVITPADVVDGLANTMMVAESTKLSGPWFAGGRATVRGLDPARPPYVGPGGQFGGIHPDHTNVLMADGSVKAIRDSVDPRVFEALSTIAGGETVPLSR